MPELPEVETLRRSLEPILVGRRLTNPTHVHAVWQLSPPGRLIFRDPRRFGGVYVVPTLEQLRTRWDRLGPDALSISSAVLRARLRGTRPIKAALLDQQAIA